MYAAISKFLAYRFPAVLLKLQCKDLQLPPRTMNLSPPLSYFTSLYLILLTLLESFASSASILLLLFSHRFPFFLRASSSGLPRAASLLTGCALPRSLTQPHALSFSCAGVFKIFISCPELDWAGNICVQLSPLIYPTGFSNLTCPKLNSFYLPLRLAFLLHSLSC